MFATNFPTLSQYKLTHTYVFTTSTLNCTTHTHVKKALEFAEQTHTSLCTQKDFVACLHPCPILHPNPYSSPSSYAHPNTTP